MEYGTVLNYLKEYGHSNVDKSVSLLFSFIHAIVTQQSSSTKSCKAWPTFISAASSLVTYEE
jgi:hypothetical protein